MARPFGSGSIRTVVAPQELLSSRERDVLRLLARGHTNREVAERLHISVRTAEWHRASIRRKLNITSRAGLVDFALVHGLLQLGG
jgi:two-component system, NarL family, response regulator NreC